MGFEFTSEMDVPSEDVFRWHERPGALQRLIPPWEKVTVIANEGGLKDDARVEIENRFGLLSMRWKLRHLNYRFGRQFSDELLKGPFSRWHHDHLFRDGEAGRSQLTERIDWRLPLEGLLGPLLRPYVDRELARLFTYRHEVTRRDTGTLVAKDKVMKVLITGASGVIGSALAPLLSTAGHQVVGLGRGSSGPVWDPVTGAIDTESYRGVDAIVHLAGENLASRRWSDVQKETLRASRVDNTQRLCQWIAAQKHKPSVFVSGSAIGVYGDRGDEWMDESSQPGTGFLADVCREWEKATSPLADSGVRVVHLRTAVALTPKGAPLAKLLPPFKMGMGGPIGDGNQYMSWIDMEDHIRAVRFVMENDQVAGPVNLSSPNPTTNAEFTRVLAKVLKRPAFARVPAFAARAAFGEMADAVLLSSTRVRPTRLSELGFEFLYPDLEGSLRHLLGRPA
jgi:uncharacterized protein (TIGR01777 family)